MEILNSAEEKFIKLIAVAKGFENPEIIDF